MKWETGRASTILTGDIVSLDGDFNRVTSVKHEKETVRISRERNSTITLNKNQLVEVYR